MTQKEEPKKPENKAFGCKWRVRIVNQDGEVTQDVQGKNSILKNFALSLQAGLGATDVTMKDTSGTNRSVGWKAKPMTYYAWVNNSGHTNSSSTLTYRAGMRMDAGDNDASFGVVAGTGNTAVTPTDHALAAQIAHGTGAGQLDYEPVLRDSVVYSAPNTIYGLHRTLQNNSGGTITVQEIGVIARLQDAASPDTTTYPFLIIRDVISPVELVDLSSIIIDYEIYTEV